MNASISTLPTLVRRKLHARELNLRFARAASFEVPDEIRVNGRALPLSVPDEPGQKTAFIELLLDDCYGLREFSKRSQINTVLDIGANVGLFGIAARRWFPRATIHMYEPNSELRDHLSHQARQFGLAMYLEAVGKEAGRVSLSFSDEQSVLTQSKPDEGGAIRQIAFRDAIRRLGESVDLVKMDCEGAEWAILDDEESWLRVRNLTMEYHLLNDESHDLIGARLSHLGFNVLHQSKAVGFGLVRATRSPRRRPS